MSSENININEVERNDPLVEDIVTIDSSEITIQDEIIQMLEYFSLHTYEATNKDPLTSVVLNRSIELMQRDYELLSIDNSNGQLSKHYPSNIMIPRKEKLKSIYHKNYVDFTKIEKSMYRGRLARSRTRFPVPVILIDGKFIVRSSTVSGLVELIPRTSFQLFQNKLHASTTTCEENTKLADAEYLKLLGVETIVDLMVENQKTKYCIPLTSSEKIETGTIYSPFKICVFPFPGCEFFKQFHDENFEASGLKFDWSQSEIDAELKLPDNFPIDYLNIKWDEYKEWDLIQITQNYMKFILNHIQDNKNSMLIHCISGWDRTPLFISLLRLSLWADDLIHRNLNEHEILYLTLAYDWFLFGHNLPGRLQKKENILHFCFSFLKYIKSDDFKIKLTSSTNLSSSPDLSEISECDGACNGDDLNSPERSDTRTTQHNQFHNNDTTELYNTILNSNKRPKIESTSPNESSCDSFSQINVAGSSRSLSDDSIERIINETNRFGSKTNKFSRKTRLTAVRQLFYKCFYKRHLDNDPIFNNNHPSSYLRQNINAAVGNVANYIFGSTNVENQ